MDWDFATGTDGGCNWSSAYQLIPMIDRCPATEMLWRDVWVTELEVGERCWLTTDRSVPVATPEQAIQAV